MTLKKIFLLLVFINCINMAKAQDLFGQDETNLLEQWDLNEPSEDNKGLFVVKKYKPLYFLPFKFTSDVNEQPVSGNSERNATEATDWNNAELKFQLSFKTKILDNVLGKKYGGDLWGAYTQTSFWQVFNTDLSRPFRATNYEPELMLIVPVKYNFLGLNGVFTGIGINHQSNGKGNPTSRSWNRIIAQIALEGKHTSVIFKPWLRIQEEADIDDNPDIENYIGRGELLVAYKKGHHTLNCTARHSLHFGENNRGSVLIDYAYSFGQHLNFYTQFFSGYGESLIDYNHRQTCIGFGLSLTGWR